MGQMGCSCQNELLVQAMEAKVPVRASKRRIRNRVKSILQPRQLSQLHKKCEHRNLKPDQLNGNRQCLISWQDVSLPTQSDNELSCPSSQYCQFTFAGSMIQLDIQVRKRIITVGSDRAQTMLPMVYQDDLFRMHIKYQYRNLYVKDTGIGYGVFVLRKSYEFQNDELLVINWKTHFMAIQKQGNKVQWRYWGEDLIEESGIVPLNDRICIIKQFQIKLKKVNSKQVVSLIDPCEKIFIYCHDYIEVMEGDILRCGLSLYQIRKIQHFIKSSRLVHRY